MNGLSHSVRFYLNLNTAFLREVKTYETYEFYLIKMLKNISF